jgi:hypothetical protein
MQLTAVHLELYSLIMHHSRVLLTAKQLLSSHGLFAHRQQFMLSVCPRQVAHKQFICIRCAAGWWDIHTQHQAH